MVLCLFHFVSYILNIIWSKFLLTIRDCKLIIHDCRLITIY